MSDRQSTSRIWSRLSLGLWLLAVQVPMAAPAVQGLVGRPNHGESLLVVGSGFGHKASGQAQPVRFDQFEDGVAGKSITTGGWWEAEQPYSNKTYDSLALPTRCVHSTKHVRWHAFGSGAPEGAMNGTFGKGGLGFEATNKAYLNLWAYLDYVDGLPESGPSGSSQLKWITLLTDGPQPWGDPSWARHESSPSVLLYLWTHDFVNTSDYARHTPSGYINPEGGSPDLLPREHHWINVSILYRESSGIGLDDGFVKVYTSRTPQGDGAYQRSSLARMKTRNSGDNGPIHSVSLGYYITNGFHEANTYWDDIYIDNSWARVELGDAAVYDSCHHREIQPCSRWSNDSIRVKLNLGSLGEGPVYLFVVDEDNMPSAGVRLDQGSGLDRRSRNAGHQGLRDEAKHVRSVDGRVVAPKGPSLEVRLKSRGRLPVELFQRLP